MTQEEYNQLDYNYIHCAGTNCPKANSCLRHTAYTMLRTNTNEHYTLANPQVITGKQPCPIYEADRKERFAWGISRIYDNVRVADMDSIRNELIYTFGRMVYYRMKQGKRVITESEQQTIRDVFNDMGYNGAAIEFDRYKEQYPRLIKLYTSA